MSAANDEAEIGQTQSSGNEESETKQHDGGSESEASEGEHTNDSLMIEGASFAKYAENDLNKQEKEKLGSEPFSGRPSSPNESSLLPDDTPSLQGSKVSSQGRNAPILYAQSPTPSLRPFDRRFQARPLAFPLDSPRAVSPAFLNTHSRQSSLADRDFPNENGENTIQEPWDVVRWTKLRKLSGQAFSETGKRNFGRPTCITVSALIALGTSKGLILVFDYNQNQSYIIGLGTKAIESGSVTSISTSADHSIIASGHASGNIFTWTIGKSAKPFLHIPPVDRNQGSEIDGHMPEVAILHIGFLGMRHTALVSADDKGMAFSHLASRGMGAVARTVRTTRILGRYPDRTKSSQKKPSSVLAFSPLPLGNAEHVSDAIGLVAMLTPYLLVIVSTTPIAQTQYKTPRPKQVAAHGAMTAALAWYPSVKLRPQKHVGVETSSRVKLVYCWSNILTILEVLEVETSGKNEKGASPSLQFKSRSRWRADEAIVGLQWLSRSVLAVLTITQQLIILEDNSLEVVNSSDLIQKHIYHVDLFSQQLNQFVDQLDEDDPSMHGVVADAFYMSFKAYKGRLFLLGFNELSFGTLSNWTDYLLALLEHGNFIGAIQLATSYYNGTTNKVTVSLPEDDESRHKIVEEKLLEMMSASLKYAFGKNVEAGKSRVDQSQLEELAAACIAACVSMTEFEYLFDDAYSWYQEENMQGIFLETLEPHIMNGDIETIPPLVIKELVSHYMAKGLEERLEEIICNLDPRTMDIDQITSLCKNNKLYDALLYVWNHALGDYTTILMDLLDQINQSNNTQQDERPKAVRLAGASTVFPYLSYILTSRAYPTGKEMPEDKALIAKAEIYHLFFSGSHGNYVRDDSGRSKTAGTERSFLNLRKILDFDAPSFLSMMNEAFEDNFLNGTHNRSVEKQVGRLTDEQTFGLSVNRQWIISILLEVVSPPRYELEDTIYLDMFIARNLPKFPQFILLPGHVLHRVLIRLCKPPGEDIAEDCQLSAEYLLSVYQPPDLSSFIPLLKNARFYRILKSIYRAENQYSKLLQVCFDDYSNPDAVFNCIGDCLRPGAGLTVDQIGDVRKVIAEHAHDLVAADVSRAALTLNEYAPDLHGSLLESLEHDESGQFEYLRNVFEPSNLSWIEGRSSTFVSNHKFMEQYVRLLCDFNPYHVTEFVERLKTGDLRLEEVIPSLEQSGVIDAAVVLMAREGKIREAVDRLTHHLYKLEAALLGLLDGVSNSPDVSNTLEAASDLAASIHKYARVGIWLCQGQTRLAQQRTISPRQSRRSVLMSQDLSVEENFWLDLIDAVVTVTKNITGMFEESARGGANDDDDDDDDSKAPSDSKSLHVETSRLSTGLRNVVQETFTALLSSTSAPRTNHAPRTDVSFLRILRAFLNRASLSSPSLSNLRAVLRSIFSAYVYEESLLSLTTRLLDKDLFVHVAEADILRRRGWRPLGQVCEGCGRRVWGPGAGGHIWDAWQRKSEELLNAKRLQGSKNANGNPIVSSNSHRKGKAANTRPTGAGSVSTDQEAAFTNSVDGTVTPRGTETGRADNEDSSSPLVIFSCRHIFHQQCLERMQGSHDPRGDIQRPAGGSERPEFACPLCVQE